ncbi:MAG: hypothetical protein WCK02_13220 [Bacteroidota bacterium]
MRYIIFVLILFIFSCKDAKKELQLNQMKAQLVDVRNGLIAENDDMDIQIQRDAIENPDRVKDFIKPFSDWNKLVDFVLHPKDSVLFYEKMSSKELKILFDSTIIKFNAILDSFPDKHFCKYIKEYSKPLETVEVSTDKDIRVINILNNQIVVLSYVKKLKKNLHYYGSDDGFTYNYRIIDNKSKQINKKYSAYLLFAMMDMSYSDADTELVKMKLNGKDIKVDYTIEIEDGIATFNFVPKQFGSYEWTVNYYLRSPMTGTIKAIPFSGEIDVK